MSDFPYSCLVEVLAMRWCLQPSWPRSDHATLWNMISMLSILPQVLEERENERMKEEKFCIDIGTQTHGWQFPDATELLQQVSS